jgi:hypothetical protein
MNAQAERAADRANRPELVDLFDHLVQGFGCAVEVLADDRFEALDELGGGLVLLQRLETCDQRRDNVAQPPRLVPLEGHSADTGLVLAFGQAGHLGVLLGDERSRRSGTAP